MCLLLLNIFHGNGIHSSADMAGVGLPASVWSGAAEHTAMCPRHGLISRPRPGSVISGGGLSCVSYCFNLSFTQFHKCGVTKLGKILSKARDILGFKIYCHWYYWCTVTYHTTMLPMLCGQQLCHDQGTIRHLCRHCTLWHQLPWSIDSSHNSSGEVTAWPCLPPWRRGAWPPSRTRTPGGPSRTCTGPAPCPG